ncbi:M24 family metallopeptidase [Mesorhizobium sp.]|uniref:M24 family metallopeptidase n=1 Tax=Mesorhizobium sp. TaxID=1871066 RepID=UPI0026007836|nr:M24 family metallopeptidase [Mesorhizobium sp.]
MLSFLSADDFHGRIQRTQAALASAGIDVAILSSFGDARYLTGLDGLPEVRPVFTVLIQTGKVAFVAPAIEAPIIRNKVAESVAEVAIEWGEWEKPGMARTFVEALVRHVEAVAPHAKTIGLDYSLAGKDLNILRNAFRSKIIEDVSPVTLAVRAIKDDALVAIVRLGAIVAEAKFKGIRDMTNPGVPEWEAALAGYNAAVTTAATILEGDEDHSPLFSGLIVMGSGSDRSANAHSVASCRIMQDGEHVQICCCTPPLLGHGMCFDRPVKIGDKDLPHGVRNIIRVAREAQEAALAAIRPGVTVGFVHDAAMEVIRRHGYEVGMQHGTGRAICCADTAIPRIMAGVEMVIHVGDLFGVEPGVYKEHVGGARFGDTIRVTETGYEAITDLSLGRTM